MIHFVKSLQDHQTILIGQPQIEQDYVEPMRLRALDGFLPRPDYINVVSFVRKKVVEGQTDIRIVIDQKNVRRRRRHTQSR